MGLDYEIVTLEVITDPNDLDDAERWWIAYGRASDWPLTNLTNGGDGFSTGSANPNYNPEVQAKQRAYWTPARRAAVGARVRAYGEQHNMRTPEGRALSKQLMIDLWADEEYRASKSGDNNHMRSPEHRARMTGENNPAKTEQAREKIRASWTPERRTAQAARCAERNRKNAKKTTKGS